MHKQAEPPTTLPLYDYITIVKYELIDIIVYVHIAQYLKYAALAQLLSETNVE